MGSLLDQCNCRRKVVQHFISQILKYSNILTKMASFKILLVVALVAFIGSTDALKCMDKATSATKECAAAEKSCVIAAKITLTGEKPSLGAVTIQGCFAKDLGGLTKEFLHPVEIENDSEISFLCTTDNCNVGKEITKVLKENVADTIAAMKGGAEGTEEGSEPEGTDDPKAIAGVGGASQITVAVATIAFSMV